MEVMVSDRQRRLPRAARVVGAMTRRVVRGEDPAIDEVSVVLAGDDLLHELNERYRRKDRATDVLSFPGDTEGPYRHLGEVVISTERAVAQAPTYAHSVAAEVSRLLVHGLLHLLGHEHDTSAGRRRMRAAERRHLDALSEWVARLESRYQTVRGR